MRIAGSQHTDEKPGFKTQVEPAKTGLEALTLDLKQSLDPKDVPNFSLHESHDGGLTAIEDLDATPIELGKAEAGLESLAGSHDNELQKLMTDIPLNISRFNGVYRFGGAEEDVSKLYVVNLSGNCSCDLDRILHIMHYADESTTIKFILSTDELFSRGILDLVGSINTTRANIIIHIAYVASIHDLLLMTTKAKIVCEMSQMIQPPMAMFYGSQVNVESSSTSIKQYLNSIMSKLISIGVLTEDNVKDLRDNRKPIVVNKAKLNK
jgi:hypothetical protein